MVAATSVAHLRLVAETRFLAGPYDHNALAHALWSLGRALEPLDAAQADKVRRKSDKMRRDLKLEPLREP